MKLIEPIAVGAVQVGDVIYCPMLVREVHPEAAGLLLGQDRPEPSAGVFVRSEDCWREAKYPETPSATTEITETEEPRRDPAEQP